MTLIVASEALVVSSLAADNTNDLQVARGPYLQLATPTSVVIRWRSNRNADSCVRYGTNANNLDQSIVFATQTTEHEVHSHPIAIERKLEGFV